MTLEVRVPQLPESIADATLVAWHKKVGDPVARDENLADLETDKVVLEVPAPAAGIVSKLEQAAGTTVTSGQLLAVIEEQAGAAAPPKAASKPEAKKPAEPKRAEPEPAPPPAPAATAGSPRATSRTTSRRSPGHRPRLPPVRGWTSVCRCRACVPESRSASWRRNLPPRC
jgi:2-oxoglutarate dehydrogenase E2 component (dihydrolipoamide succinyltransferase)